MPLVDKADPNNYMNEPGEGTLRAGAESGPIKSTDNLPSTRSKASAAQVAGTEIERDLWGGNQTVKARGQKYLPQGPAEGGPQYADRLARSVFTGFFRRTVEAVVGLMFRVDPKLGEDVPVKIKELWENIDNEGTHGDVFLRQIETDAQTVGHAAILVEYPKTTGSETVADEMAQHIRPYWVPIKKDNILSWRTENQGGEIVLTQIVLEEKSMVPSGGYGEKEQTWYRVIKNTGGVVTWELWSVKNRVPFLEDEGIYANQTEIPLPEISTSGSESMFVSTPPLLDLSFLNIAHYQQSSDYWNAIHLGNSPILFGKGIPNATNDDGEPVDEIAVGAGSALLTDAVEADLKYVNHDGASLGSSKASLDDLKADMGTLGVGMLAPQKRVAETAEAQRLSKSTQDSALSVSARALQDGVENALQFTANYLKIPDGGSITINRDFEGLLLDAPVMQAFAELSKAGFPPRAILEALQQGGRISPEADLDELEMEWLMGKELNIQVPDPDIEPDET